VINDDEPPSEAQARQIATGQYMALSAAVHALMATHPRPAEIRAMFMHFLSVPDQILLTQQALQADDGLRQAYAEVRLSLLDALPGS
jgi:hypothetical protein